ncbi:methylase [Paenibacillus sp. FSL H8-0548]|uniref:class I SAM-dependent methyltransferase n=1 Tax=Paenibacillus sp. FSL H8-0548 TaxID=1920422 RepID=UPI00096C3F82|nr:methyltransferase domain-containing protein [Paenibacillus sp. FSL H8-0548]OMF21674.1 methylase [Paenibacillus sp. FSL H8-0548]
MMIKKHYEQIGVAMTCRSYEEYVRMFDLLPEDMENGRLLDVAAGGSSFTAEANARGYSAYAVDPRYGAGIKEWIQEATEEIETSTAKLAKLQENFDWSYYESLEKHRAGRVASIERFAAHVLDAEHQERYIDGKLPELPFADDSFSLVLCSHFMFLYADQFGPEFHTKAVLELMRVCKPGGQIRIYPLVSLNWERYAELGKLLEIIEFNGGKAQLLTSHLPFIPSSTEYLKINAAKQ